MQEAITNKLDIILIQEPPPKFQIRTSDGIRYFFGTHPSQHNHPESVIIVLNTKVKLKQIHTSNHLISAIDLVQYDLRLINVYGPPRLDIGRLISLIMQVITENAIISGDFNARSTTWADKITNSRGSKLQDFIENNHLLTFYSMEGPTFQVTRGETVFESNIDISLCTPGVSHLLHDWRLSQKDLASDHRPITFSISQATQEPNIIDTDRKRKNWQLGKTDWEIFRTTMSFSCDRLEEDIQKIENCIDLDAWVDSFYSLLENALKNSGARESQSKNIRSFPWWSEEIENLRITLTKAKRRLNRVSPRSRKRFNQWVRDLTEKIKTKIDENRKEYWTKFFEEASVENAWDQFYKVIKSRNRSPLPTSIQTDGLTITGDQNLADFYVNYFFGVSQGASTPLPKDHTTHHLSTVHHIPFNIVELNHVISTFSSRKAPGKDGFSIEIYKNLPNATLTLIAKFFDKCITNAYFPLSFKRSITVLIPKPGADPTNPKAVRPIGLLPVLGKFLEKLILLRLDDWLGSVMSPRQYGFTRGKSTKDALSKILKEINTNKESKRASLLISFDIQGAFDCVGWKDIIQVLNKRECPAAFKNILLSYLNERYTELIFGNSVSVIKNSRGTVQGSCLGPTLWNLIVNEYLLSIHEQTTVYVAAYADDISLVASLGGNSLEQDQQNLESELRRLEQWAMAYSLKFSINKTKCVWLPGQLKIIKQPSVNLFNQSLEYVESTKILGLTIDSKLNYSSHIKTTSLTIEKLLFSTKRSLGWPKPTLSLLRLIHNSVILPKMTYASELYYGQINASLKSKITSIHRKVLLLISGAYRTTPYASLCLLCDVHPILITFSRLEREYKTLQGDLVLPSLAPDRLIESKPPKTFSRNAINISSLIGKKIRSNDNFNIVTPEDGLECYTDGSKTAEGVGAGVVFFNHCNRVLEEICEPLFSYASIYQAESFALNQAITKCFKFKKKGYNSANIYTDSESLYTSFQSTYEQGQLIEQARSLALELVSQGFQIKIFWIKAHANFTGNEYADYLAKKATSSHRKVQFSTVPRSYIKKQIKEIALAEAQQWYETAKSNSFLISDLKFGWTNGQNNNLNKQSIWLLSGHGPFKDYLNRFHASPDSICACLVAKADNQHYATNCDATRTERSILTNEYDLQENDFCLAISLCLSQGPLDKLNQACRLITRKLLILNNTN